jgi:hypothetical protein
VSDSLKDYNMKSIQGPKIYFVVASFSAEGYLNLGLYFRSRYRTAPDLPYQRHVSYYSASQNACLQWLVLYYLITTESVSIKRVTINREVAEHTGCSLQGEVRQGKMIF